MGARVIYFCLSALADMEEKGFGVVENAVLLGAAVPRSTGSWLRMRSVVAGRLVNGYSERDWVLSFAYRYNSFEMAIAGLGPVQGAGVENANLSEIVNGHFQYPNKMPQILKLLKLDQ